MTARTNPELAPDLVAGLRRLKLATVRAIAPEVLVTAKTQRWSPEDLLRTLVEAEIAARDESNARSRLRAAGFPVLLSEGLSPGAAVQRLMSTLDTSVVCG